MKASLLIVDDETQIREMLSRHFRLMGFEAHVAGNGREAIGVLESHKIDIVISDIMMPVMDGVELLRYIRQHCPMTHTIMMTGYVTLDNALTCMRLGADTLIFKPLEDMQLLETAVSSAMDAIRHWLELLKELQAMKPLESGALNG